MADDEGRAGGRPRRRPAKPAGDSGQQGSSRADGPQTPPDGRQAPSHGAQAAARGRQALPRGPQALPREQVAEHQRARLHRAMVECVDEHGYPATTISELVARAHISRRSFYERYRNKEECLLGAYDEIIGRLGLRLAAVRDPALPWIEQLETFVRTLFDAAADRPDAARLVCVEMGAAGPVGVQRWANGAERLQRHLVDGFAAAPGAGTVPDPVARAMVGALRRVLYTRVRRARTGKALRTDLSQTVPDLMAWIGTYYPSPEALPAHARKTGASAHRGQGRGRRAGGHTRGEAAAGARGEAPALWLGGRAPGTLSAPSLSGERGLPRGEHNLPRGFVEHNQRERIFDAIANLTAARGYPALSLDDVAAEAAVSLQTFYKHFSSKEEAFVATYEAGHARAMAVVNQALARQSSWVGAVRTGAAALLELLACEPAYAHLACVDVMVAYPHMARRAYEANDFYAGLLDLRMASDAPTRAVAPVVGEAIVGGVYELLHDHVLRGRTRELPELEDYVAYIALAPFMGAREAWTAITAA